MTQEALRMAHKALIGLSIKHGEMTDEGMDAIAAIKEALAQEQEQEPVKIAHRHEWFRTGEMKVGQMRCISCGTWGHEEMPQRTWVGLTDDEIDEWTPEIHTVIKAIEAKLKERNT